MELRNRIDTLVLKSEMVRKLGGKATEYFDQLSKFLTRKITRSDFHNSCFRMIGKENVHLHNCLIRSIVQNAMLPETPPRKEKKVEGASSARKPNGEGSNGSSLCRLLPPCPRKGRTPCKPGRSARYQPYSLGPNGKSSGLNVGYRPRPLSPNGRSSNNAVEDTRIENQEKESPMELDSSGSRPPSSEESEVFAQAHSSTVSSDVVVKDVGSKNQEKASPMELDSSSSRTPASEVDEEFGQLAGSYYLRSRSPIRAPLGVYVHSKDGQTISDNSSASSNRILICRNTNELPDTMSLKKCLEQKLEKEGLKLSTDCANLINKSLELYLERLIKPCLDVARSHSGQDQLSEGHSKGVSNNMQPIRQVQQPSRPVVASMSDFQAAMELNPTILGHQWPTHLEKIVFWESQNGMEN